MQKYQQMSRDDVEQDRKDLQGPEHAGTGS